MLLALDPGMCSPGVALFQGDVLFRAGRVIAPSGLAALAPGKRWLEVAKLIVAWAGEHVPPFVPVAQIVFELPQWYRASKSKGDPNDLVGVAGVAANVTGLFGLAVPEVFSPTPAEWIGQLSKVCPTCKGKAKKKCKDCLGSAWETPRGRRIRSRLTGAELALVPDQNDAIDAVGLGLFQLGRLAPRSVFSNGRDGH